MIAPGNCNSFNDVEEEKDDDSIRNEDDGVEGEGTVPSSEVTGRVVTCAIVTNNELEDFRRRWKSEINEQKTQNIKSNQPSSIKQVSNNNVEYEMEKSYSLSLDVKNNKSNPGHMHEKYRECIVDNDDDCDDHKESTKSLMDNIICKSGYDQMSVHISDLPLEVLDLIFKWVVSNYLDVKSLEMLSIVCKYFYQLARDEDLWKAICMRTWEKDYSLTPCYSSYRQMFVERPHVMFNGCYISKVTYFRQGEQSLDGFYKPYHLVKYYRYIRFHPGGMVYMFMSPEDPREAVHHLKNKSDFVPGLHCGCYKLSDDKVSLALKKIPEPSSKLKRVVKNCYYGDYEQTFFLETSLKTIKHRRNTKLSWLKYFMHRINKTTGEFTTMTFDITDNMYPPFYFYPVRSFSAQSEFPLW